MKRILQVVAITATLLPFGMNAIAGGHSKAIMPVTNTSPNYFNGFYVGAGAGAATLTNEYRNRTNTVSYAVDPSIYDFAGTLFAGWGKVFKNSYYLGAELLGHYYSGTVRSLERSNETSTIKTIFGKHGNDFSYGANARFGYLISSKTMFYGILGINYAKFETTDSFTNHEDKTKTVTDSRHRCGWVIGVGTEMYLTDRVSLRTQYSYTNYRQYTYDGINDRGDHYENRINPYRTLLTLDLAYHFAQ